MEEKIYKYPEWQLWLLILVVIFQSVFIIKAYDQVAQLKPAGQKLPDSQKAEIQLGFTPAKLDIKKGESAKVNLVLKPGKKINISGMDVVLIFDSNLIQISQSEVYKILPTVITNNENEVKGKIGWTYLNEKVEPIWFDAPVNVLSLTVKGKNSGSGKIKILKEEKLASTVIVEDVTARKIPFSAEELIVNVK